MAARSPLELYLVAVFVLFAGFAATALYVGGDLGLKRHARRFAISRRYAVVVAALGILTPAALALVGSHGGVERFAGMGRSEVRSVGLTFFLYWGLFVGGLLSFASAAGSLRTYYRLARSPTDGSGRVPVSGLTAGSPGRTPFRRTEAFCWNWRVEVYNLYGTDNDNWIVRDLGSGGVPFRVETDAESVGVDPTDARLDLVDERTLTLAEGESLPESVGHEAARRIEREYGDNRRRYVEAALEPGSAVTAIGRLTGPDGGRSLEADGDEPVEVIEGSAGAVRSRYRTRIAAAALVGGLATWFGFVALRGFFGL